MRVLWFSLALGLLICALPGQAAETKYRDAAILAARWIRTAAVASAQGQTWLPTPNDRKTLKNSLYSGTAGVVIFYLEVYRAAPSDTVALQEAQAGADYLLATLPNEKEAGLYTGVAGIGFALQEAYKATKQTKYQDGAMECVKWLREKAKPVGQGIAWNDTTDIIAGSAGIGLFLIYADREKIAPDGKELAAKAGLRLLELAKPDSGGFKWAMDAKEPRQMPNFAHGTAGIAYFLATLYGETKRKEFLDGALAGAKYLLAVADTSGEGCQIFYDDADGKNLHYLGWCHGPTGTARLFVRLYRITGDKVWLDWVKRSAKSILDSGIPEKPTPGFWNNIGQCCGSAGIASFFLDVHRLTKEKVYLDFARRMTDNLLSRGEKTKDSKGNEMMKWTQAEHRLKPDLLVAQTGYMQGAAGVGMWLLQMDAFEQKKQPYIRLPDSPF